MNCRRKLFQLLSLPFGFGFAAGCGVPLLGHTATLSEAWDAYLRPGCHVLFVLPTTQLEVQTKWLGPITVSLLAQRYRGACPSEPVKVNDVEFDRPVLDVLRIQTGLGRDFFRLHVLGGYAVDNQPVSSPSELARDRVLPVEASIEMRIAHDLGLEDRGFEDRWYEIRYPATEVRIHCGASRDFVNRAGEINPLQRYCGPAPFPKFAGLVIRYELSQWRQPAPESVSTDASTEPGAILQFDMRLREWLVSLERPK